MKLLVKPMLALALFLCAASANALIIEISDGTNTITVNDTNDSDLDSDAVDNDGKVVINKALGSWMINVVTGLSYSDLYVDKLDLFSVNVSGGAGTLTVRLTDTGFSRHEANYMTAFGGTTDGSVRFETWLDDDNAAFGQGLLLADSGILSDPAFSGQRSGGISANDDYSISIFATISHTAGPFQITSFDYAVTVPEPGTLALIGIGLLGLGLFRRPAMQRINA